MITCPSCGHENQQSAVECAKCSTNILWALENLSWTKMHIRSRFVLRKLTSGYAQLQVSK